MPNFTLGPDFIKRTREITTKPIEVHLMIEQPEHFINLFRQTGADRLTIHAEATTNLQGTLARIQAAGMKAGVALNPATPLEVLDYVYDVVDYIVIMTVNPGFAGQAFIPAMYGKIAKLSMLLHERDLNIPIEVDGSMGAATIPKCKVAGARYFIGGTSSVYHPGKTLTENVNGTQMLINGNNLS